MRQRNWLLPVALCALGLLGSEAARGQDYYAPAPRVREVTEISDAGYYVQETQAKSDAAAVKSESSPADTQPVVESNEPGYKSYVAGSRFCRGGALGEPWKLPQPNALACRDIQIGGWISAGVYSNAYGDRSNGPLGMNNVGDGATMNQLWVFGEKKTKTDGCGVDWGFRTDYLFGVDGQDTQAFGDQSWDYGWNSSRDYGSAIPQIYTDLAINNLTLRFGRFFTPIGSEVVPAVNNFFYSHSYQMSYAEPYTHTGMLAMYKVNDKLTGTVGWTDGWDGGFENRNGASTFLGGFTLAPSEKTTIAWFCSAGNFGDGRYGGNAGDVYMNSFVLTYKLTERWSYMFQNDIGVNYNLAGGDTHWYGINQNLIYKINDRTSAGGRLEWFDDVNGARVTGDGFGRHIGNPGNYWEMTYGVNYKPHANVTLRPEIRYDWFNGQIVNQGPFNRGHSTSQFSGGFDAIFTF